MREFALRGLKDFYANLEARVGRKAEQIRMRTLLESFDDPAPGSVGIGLPTPAP